MKIFVYIFTAYILWLISAPCIDESQDKLINAIERTHNTQHDQAQGSDHCSPFCTCDCCVSPSVYQECNINFRVSFLKVKIFSAPSPNYFSILSSSIWQPPKLG